MEELSVILPVYNEEIYISEAIESVLNQTYKNFELIIVDDGSTDNSLKIIKEHQIKDKRIKIITRENKGLVYSLNEGISIAKGKYIARMDADDISDRERFEMQICFLKSNESADIVGTYITVIGDTNRAINIEQWFNQKWKVEEMLDRCMEGCIIAHPTAMIKRGVIESIGGYRDKYPRFEDDDLWIRAIKSGYKILNLDEKLLKYRVHDDSKSSTDALEYESFLYERLAFKLEHFFIDNNEFDLFIWGCGRGAKIALQYFKDIGINIEGFIDSYKEGFFEGKKVYDRDILAKAKNPYVFIATQMGYKEVKDYLEKIETKNYMYIL